MNIFRKDSYQLFVFHSVFMQKLHVASSSVLAIGPPANFQILLTYEEVLKSQKWRSMLIVTCKLVLSSVICGVTSMQSL